MVQVTLPRVPVAARDLVPNHLVRDTDVVLQTVTVAPPLGTIAAADQVVNHYLRVAKPRGSTFNEDDLATAPALPAPASRLISIGLDAPAALAGLLDPGQLVDVLGIPKAAANETALPVRIGAALPVVAVIKQTAPATPAVIVILEVPGAADDPTATAEAEATCRRLVGASDLRLVVRAP
jgi:hypothetical protein